MKIAQPDGAGPAALEAARVSLEVAERERARSESQTVTAKRTLDSDATEERSSLERLEGTEARLAGYVELSV